MDSFYEALLSDNDNAIPKEYDWFAPLIGDWLFDYSEPNGRKLKGEWYFRKVLEGTAVEDIFICPSRETKQITPQPDAEYGAAIRIFNAKKHCYDMTYICTKYTVRLEVHMVDGRIECTVTDNPSNKWVFSDITEDTFHWQNIDVLENGSWKVNCEVFARLLSKKCSA